MKILAWIVAAVIVMAVTFYVLAYKAFVIDVSLWAPSAHAQDHSAGHNDYRGWSSRKAENCCNNQDCHSLAPEEWGEGPDGTWVMIKGEKCPVNQEHFLTRGKSPNWERAHACINDRAWNVPPCARLLCFTGVPNG